MPLLSCLPSANAKERDETTAFRSTRSRPLKGEAKIPGDKSISHRALMLGGIAQGTTTITGLLEGEDVLHTAGALRAMGAEIEKTSEGLWHCRGVGSAGLKEPSCILEMGNSGTSTRLLAGLVSGYKITSFFTGDSSLIKRPMKRIMAPLEEMGARFMTREGGRLPMAVQGTDGVRAISYRLPMASAQVKSAILLCGLRAKTGNTVVIEEKPTRNYTENMLRHFGVQIQVEKDSSGADVITLAAGQSLRVAPVCVPSDPSSAAFPVVAALIREGSDIFLPNIGLNPTRTGLYETLLEMGADISFENERIEAGERIADLRIRSHGPLKGVVVPEERVPSMIDEFPILAVAASCAQGTTRMSGLEELRIKESDRLLMMARGLEACGVRLEMGEASLIIHGTGKPPAGGTRVETALDHRIAMSFLVLGMASDNPIEIDDIRPVNTSFPEFVGVMNMLAGEKEIKQ